MLNSVASISIREKNLNMYDSLHQFCHGCWFSGSIFHSTFNSFEQFLEPRRVTQHMFGYECKASETSEHLCLLRRMLVANDELKSDTITILTY